MLLAPADWLSVRQHAIKQTQSLPCGGYFLSSPQSLQPITMCCALMCCAFASRGAGIAFAIQPMFRRCRCFRFLFAAMLAGMVLVGTTGCNLIFPDISHQPVVHNPFPQLSRWRSRRSSTRATSRRSTAASSRWPTLPSCKQCPASKSCRWASSKKRSSRHQVDLSRSGRSATAGARFWASMPSSSARSPITRRTIRRAAACASNGTRRIRASTKFRPATACRGARRRKSTFRRRWCSSRRWRWPKRSWRRKRRHAKRRRSIRRRDASPAEPHNSAHSLPPTRNGQRRGKDGHADYAGKTNAAVPSLREAQADSESASAIAQSTKSKLPTKNCQRATARRHAVPSLQPDSAAAGCYDRCDRRTRRCCRQIGPTSAASFRRRRAPCGRRAARTMVRL